MWDVSSWQIKRECYWFACGMCSLPTLVSVILSLSLDPKTTLPAYTIQSWRYWIPCKFFSSSFLLDTYHPPFPSFWYNSPYPLLHSWHNLYDPMDDVDTCFDDMIPSRLIKVMSVQVVSPPHRHQPQPVIQRHIPIINNNNNMLHLLITCRVILPSISWQQQHQVL